MKKEIEVLFRVDEGGDWERLVFYRNGVSIGGGFGNYHITAENVLDKMAELGIKYFIKEQISEDD